MSGLICTKQQLLKTAINNLQTENSYIFYKSVKNRFSSKHDSKAVKKKNICKKKFTFAQHWCCFLTSG